jgi:hypothetical protein
VYKIKVQALHYICSRTPHREQKTHLNGVTQDQDTIELKKKEKDDKKNTTVK